MGEEGGGRRVRGEVRRGGERERGGRESGESLREGRRG